MKKELENQQNLERIKVEKQFARPGKQRYEVNGSRHRCDEQEPDDESVEDELPEQLKDGRGQGGRQELPCLEAL